MKNIISLEDQVGSILLDSRVANAANACLQLDKGGGFLVHLSDEGFLHVGGIAATDARKLEEFRKKIHVSGENLSKPLDNNNLRIIKEYGLDDLSLYTEGSSFYHEKGKGLFALTKWVVDIVTEDSRRALMWKGPNGKRIDDFTSIIREMPYVIDLFQLNELKKDYDDIILVDGRLIYEGSQNIQLLVLEQKVPHLPDERLKRMALVGVYEAIIPQIKEVMRKFYQKYKGYVNFKEGKVELESIP